MGYRQNDFVNRAIARAVKNKDIELTIAPTLDAKAAKPKEDKPKDGKSKDEENPFKNPYDEFLKTWKQGDPLPLIPPGMTMHLCKFGNPLHTDTNYFDLHDEYKTKKPKVKFKHPDLTLDSKSLGPKLRDEVDTLLSRAMMGRFGLKPWVDDKNKLRCPEGTPAANQFTDQRMSNCFIVSPATAAGSANRMARRAGSAIANASQVGGRTQGGFEAARDMNNLTQQDFIAMGYDAVSARMAVGGRIIGAMTGTPGTRYDPSRRSGPSEPYLLGKKEKTQRGKRSTMLAMTNHELIRSGAIKLPSGQDIGDITDESNFMRVMTELFPQVEPNEFKYYFQNAIPANLRWEQKREAKRGIQAFWEAMISEAIANPDHAKWVTQFNVDYNMSSAFEVTLDHFAPALDSNGRMVSNAGRKLVGGRNAAEGGIHMIMKINPAKLFQSSLGFHNGDARSSGIHDSVEGDMHYTATHEFGHLAHFSSAMQALGFDVNTLSRYNTAPTHFTGSATTGGAPAWRPGKENGGWIIDFANMRNPMNSPSIELVRDAAQSLQTRQYMGGRGNFNSADLQKDLMEFYEAFGEAVTNNITDTAEDLMLMAQFAGGEYAASNPIETRAEYYAARRMYGETNSQARFLTPQRYPFNIKPPRPGGRGPVNQNLRNINYVQDFADAVAAGSPAQSFSARTGLPGTPLTSGEVVQRLNNSGFSTFGVHPGTWNLTGAMAMGGNNRRVSLHAQQVQDWVKQDERNARNKKKNKKPTLSIPYMSNDDISSELTYLEQEINRLSGETDYLSVRGRDEMASRYENLKSEANKRKRRSILGAATGMNNRSGITGAMATEKKYYPREPSYGAFIGDAQKIFGNAKTWEEFKKLYNDKEVIFFDYETTGIELDKDGRTIAKGSPVQIGAVKMKGGKVIERFNVFMKPDQPLGDWSKQNLKDKDGNLLTDEWLDNQTSILNAHQMLSEFAGSNAIFGVQYAPFDKDVLDSTLEKIGIQWRPSGYLDTKDIAEHTLPKWSPENPDGPSEVRNGERRASNGLKAITEYLGVDLGSKHHTADADSEAAGMVMSALIDKAIEKDFPTNVLDIKSQNERISKAKDDYEKAVADFEQYVVQKQDGITGAMRASTKIASTRKSNRRTAEIKRAINEAGGNFGGDTSVRYINELKPSDTMLGATLISETKQARNKERVNVLTALKDVVKTDFITNTEAPVAVAAPPSAPPPDDPNDPNKINPADIAKHNFDVKNALNGLNPAFHKYLNETPIEELKKDLEFAILDFHEGLDKQPRTHVPGRFLKDLIENGFKNSHQRNEITGLDKILSKYEADIGIHPDTPIDMRPASGFVLHMDELQREQNDINKFLKNSGKEKVDRYFPNLVDFPHSKRTRGNDWNFGNAEVILNPGVADRTAYGNGELFNNHIEPVGMNSSDREVIARAHIDAAFKTDNRAENIIEHLYNSFKGDHDAYRNEKYATSPGRSWEPREASIAGGFNADDIDEIKIPFDSIPKNFIAGHPDAPATNSAMGKDSYTKDSESFLNGLKEKIISDEVMSKINPTEEERKIIKDILTSKPGEFSIPDSVQKGMNRFGADEFDIKQDIDKYLRLEAAEAMRKAMDEKGIKLSITNKFGLNVFDPRAFDKNASKKSTAREAMRNKIENQIEEIIKDMREAKNRISGTNESPDKGV